MKGDTEAILMIFFFFFGATVMYFAEPISAEPFLKILIPAISSFLAVFMGAHLAFKSYQKQQAEQRKKKNLQSSTIAISKLKSTINYFTQFYYGVYSFLPKEKLNNNNLIISMSLVELVYAIILFKKVNYSFSIDVDDLVFLYGSKNSELVNKIIILQVKVNDLVDSINFRSSFFHDNIYEKIDPFVEKNKRKPTVDEFIELVGYKNSSGVVHYTELMNRQLEDCLVDTLSVLTELLNAVKEIYPESISYDMNIKIPNFFTIIIEKFIKDE
jgi:hypothetical protein